MNLVPLKYCLIIVFKKKREKERKDGMPKKHDPANKIKHEKEHVFTCALT